MPKHICVMYFFFGVDILTNCFCMLSSYFSLFQATGSCRGQSDGWLSTRWVLCGLAMSEVLSEGHLLASFFLASGLSSVRQEYGRRSINQRPDAGWRNAGTHELWHGGGSQQERWDGLSLFRVFFYETRLNLESRNYNQDPRTKILDDIYVYEATVNCICRNKVIFNQGYGAFAGSSNFS